MQQNDRVRALQLQLLRILAERVPINSGMFIAGIESQIGWMTHVPWPASTLDQHRVEAGQLLLLVPAITELRLLDSTGKERLRVSGVTNDSVEPGAHFFREPEFIVTVKSRCGYGLSCPILREQQWSEQPCVRPVRGSRDRWP